MKRLPVIIAQQHTEVDSYRQDASTFVHKEVIVLPRVTGVLLTGSVARGDARKGPNGIMIDLNLILDRNEAINLTECFGPSIESADFPYHAIQRENQLFALEAIPFEKLLNIKEQPESVIYAKKESLILFDRDGQITEWKNTAFQLTETEIRNRAMMYYSWFRYLVGEYRIKKWAYREAWVQLSHNFNVACELFCSFLYCINGSFIPWKDWMVYLTYELRKKPEDYEHLIHSMYRSFLTKKEMTTRSVWIQKAKDWMEKYCKEREWIQE